MPKRKQGMLFGSDPADAREPKEIKKRAKKAFPADTVFSASQKVPNQETDYGDDQKNRDAKPLSVAQFIALLNNRLREIDVSIMGEVSRVSSPPSGHVYFSLKDENADCVIDCVVWKSQYDILGIRLEAGMRIVAVGHADVYGPTGKLSFKARAIELTGEGVLKKRYEELKKKLAAEGVFAEERKRPIPESPRRIGVITSRNGAVIHDILNNLGRFGFKVQLADARVEGPEAVGSLLAAIRAFKNIPIDVLVIARGGGSMEALQAFDNERLVRELIAFPVPVIAGIGHHQDVPLAALAADAHASTPTAVANLLNRSWQEASFRVGNSSEKILGTYRKIVLRATALLDPAPYSRSLVRMCARVNEAIGKWEIEIMGIFGQNIFGAKEKLTMLTRIIAANDPARNLRLGYSIVRKNGKVVKSVKGLDVGNRFDLQLADGIIEGQVTKID
jgi:exodeoxyribonuclease VII large subunit